jgi:hypothetical protein
VLVIGQKKAGIEKSKAARRRLSTSRQIVRSRDANCCWGIATAIGHETDAKEAKGAEKKVIEEEMAARERQAQDE